MGGGGQIVSPLSICMSVYPVHKSVHTFSTYIRKMAIIVGCDPFSTLKNGVCSISFEKISVLNSYFIHRYIIMKYRSSLI